MKTPSENERLRRKVRRMARELGRRAQQLDEYGQHIDTLFDRLGTLEHVAQAIVRGEEKEARAWLSR